LQWYLDALTPDLQTVDPDGEIILDGVLPGIGIHTEPVTDVLFEPATKQVLYDTEISRICNQQSIVVSSVVMDCLALRSVCTFFRSCRYRGKPLAIADKLSATAAPGQVCRR
jgi:hypothetical protein